MPYNNVNHVFNHYFFLLFIFNDDLECYEYPFFFYSIIYTAHKAPQIHTPTIYTPQGGRRAEFLTNIFENTRKYKKIPYNLVGSGYCAL